MKHSIYFILLLALLTSCRCKCNCNCNCENCRCVPREIDPPPPDEDSILLESIRDSIAIMEREVLFGSFTEDGLCNPWITESNISKYKSFIDRQKEKVKNNSDAAGLISWMDSRKKEVMENEGEIEELAWSRESITTDGTQMNYWLCHTNKDNEEKPWLVIILHGKLPPNESPMHIGQGHKCIRHYMDAIGKKCILLYPISPNRSDWGDYTNILKQMIDKYSDQIDTSRIYIAGESNGAVGVWQMINRYADTFAGAMPVAIDIPYSVRNHPNLRMCMTQELSHNANKQFITGMSNKRFDSVGDNHGSCIQQSYTTERLDWLFE